MSGQRVLVVGARTGSLGEAVATSLQRGRYAAYTAGISGEAVPLDVMANSMDHMRDLLRNLVPRHVICTVGANLPETSDDDPQDWYRWHFEANVVGPMRLLKAWQQVAMEDGYLPDAGLLHYVAISSNSARIPRTQSAAYCASKAALSMALRVKGREGRAGDTFGMLVYGYEPGLLADTGMTQDTRARLPGVPLTRMQGSLVQGGLPAADLAEQIVRNLGGGPGLNGTLQPLDSGEL